MRKNRSSTMKKSLKPSKNNIDDTLEIAIDIMINIANANISDMSDDKAADIFIRSVLDVVYPGGDSSIYESVEKTSKKEILLLIPSIKKIFNMGVRKHNRKLRNSTRRAKMVGGQRRRDFYQIAVILAGFRLIMMLPDVLELVRDAARERGFDEMVGIQYGMASVYLIFGGICIVLMQAMNYVNRMNNGGVIMQIPTIAAARHIGIIDIEAANIGVNSISYDNFQNGEEIVILQRIQGIPPHTFMFKLEGIEQWFQQKIHRGEFPTNPLTGLAITQADIERATLNIV